ncbi:hypothetical protein FOA52_007470 [Chlamydomonas sp. UWO 241]|nr:hypothetical protein FOA52_007470 [Chlamydomonas sp. UWO 241]
MENKPASALGYALGLWPDIERLEADCDVDSVSVISGAPLCKLKALSLVNRVGGQEWSVPALSQTAAAGLQELHFSNSYNPIPNLSIETVRGYSQLRKLSLFGCNISDLEDLRIYGLAGHLPGLAALKAAMPRLRILQ